MVIDKFNRCQHETVLSRIPKRTRGTTKGSIGKLPESKRTVAHGPVKGITRTYILRSEPRPKAKTQYSHFTNHTLLDLGFHRQKNNTPKIQKTVATPMLCRTRFKPMIVVRVPSHYTKNKTGVHFDTRGSSQESGAVQLRSRNIEQQSFSLKSSQ